MGRFTECLDEAFRSGTTFGLHAGHIATVGSVAITNASIAVDVNVNDYVSVTQSGAYITVLGSVNVNNNTAGSVVYMPAGSVTVMNPPYLGSTYYISGVDTVLGSVAITNTVLPTGSVVQSTNPWITLGSTQLTNTVLPTGSVVQSTNPWIVLGSTQCTNPPYLGSTYYFSGVQEVSGLVNQGTNPWIVQNYPNSAGYIVGIHMANSGTAAATDFSGTAINSSATARYLHNVTVYGGLAADDSFAVRLSGITLAEKYIVSGVWTTANSSHSCDFNAPWSWTSGAELLILIDNNTAKTASVNAIAKYTL